MNKFDNVGLLPAIGENRTRQLETAIREGKLKADSKDSEQKSPDVKSFSSSSSSDEGDEPEEIQRRTNPKILIRQASELAVGAKSKQKPASIAIK